jgi:N,N'-diacetyllegionaminate synthase
MNKSYLYTETAFHHQGDINFLKRLIDASAEAGANGVKFQVLTNINDFVSAKHKAFKDLSSYCLNLKQWDEIFIYTQQKGLDIIMMPLNLQSVELCTKHTIKYLDIHSVSFNDHELLIEIKNTKVPVILGVGGRTFQEIIDKKDYYGNQLQVLMVGFQSFPSKLQEVRMGKIRSLKDLFPGMLIGYADHSAFDHEHAIISNEYARFLGATIFEKHITIQEGVERVDFSAAVSVEKLKSIVQKLDFIDSYILIDPASSMKMNESEIVYRNRQLRCVAANTIPLGTVLSKENISLKLVDNQENTFALIEELVGKKLMRSLDSDDVITKDLVI